MGFNEFQLNLIVFNKNYLQQLRPKGRVYRVYNAIEVSRMNFNKQLFLIKEKNIKQKEFYKNER